ncbi:hypothetical protein SAMN05216480_12020 [Pustulibacterium marinum]|uniref:PD-(D/E)XK nuclease superfamily protein n=1 Tax=Pustulibacterium marinum TaxID=1224947 RepID=A0A1I7IRF9_9FLAO|nr:hypothetical protein [Pustulibacterium marinum]SFU75520.1 hypothetical protein SAMN05216480_12020 [Pustulibacterium marinum]
MSFTELYVFLNETEIPLEKRKDGFLEIIRKDHNENINSNIYAYYLSCEIEELKSTFLDALLSIIYEKTLRKFQFTRAFTTTEMTTSNGRIDIFIRDLINPVAIIIENKIHHRLNNDLLEYWNYFKSKDANKIGILLTLHNHVIPENVKDKFINITHWEWISKIKNIIDLNNINDTSQKIYLNDFFKTIENLTTTYKMNDSAKFFFQNAKKINETYETLLEGHKFLNDQYELIASKLGLQTFGSEITWKNIWDESNLIDTYFTIITKDLILGKAYKYQIILELNREDKAKESEIKEKFQNHPQFNNEYIGISKDSYKHLQVRDYEISIEELSRFSEIVISQIQKDFADLFIQIIKFLYPNKDISRWENNFILESQ